VLSIAWSTLFIRCYFGNAHKKNKYRENFILEQKYRRDARKNKKKRAFDSKYYGRLQEVKLRKPLLNDLDRLLSLPDDLDEAIDWIKDGIFEHIAYQSQADQYQNQADQLWKRHIGPILRIKELINKIAAEDIEMVRESLLRPFEEKISPGGPKDLSKRLVVCELRNCLSLCVKKGRGRNNLLKREKKIFGAEYTDLILKILDLFFNDVTDKRVVQRYLKEYENKQFPPELLKFIIVYSRDQIKSMFPKIV